MSLVDFVRSFGIGAVAGLRTFTAPAAVHGTGGSVWSGPMLLLAAGEFVGDKVPATPSRLAPAPFIARLASGSWCGGELAARANASRTAGIAAGALGAATAAWLGYAIRHEITERGIPDFAIAVVEDGIALLGARLATAG